MQTRKRHDQPPQKGQKGQEELELFRVLLDHTSDLIFLVDTNSGVVLDVNQAARDLLGISKVHLAWNTFLEHFELARHSPLRDGAGAAGDNESHEVLHVTAAGERIYFDLTLSTVNLGANRYTIGVARDITARKLTEIALRESEHRLRTLFETAPVGIFRSTPAGRYLASNPTNAAIYGYDSSEEFLAAGMDIPQDIYADPARRDAFLRRLRADGEVKSFESQRKRRDGSLAWVSTSARLSVDPATNAEVIEGFSVDFTGRKLAEQKLERSEEKFRSIVESSPAAMYFYRLEPDGRLLLMGVNPAAKALRCDGPLDILGIALKEASPSPAGTDIPAFFLKVARGELGAQSFQTSFKSDQGLCFYDMHVFRTGPDTVDVDVLDITERVRMQEMMIQTEKMMSLGGLAAGMAHEINNPLSGILQNVQVVQHRLTANTPINAEAAERVGCCFQAITSFMRNRDILVALDRVREAGGRATQVVKSMLEFSRRSESSNAPTDINDLLEKSLSLCSTDYDLKKKYDFRNICIERAYAADLPEVPCSKTQIQQVVMNILANAAQAMAGMPSPKIILRTALVDGSVRIDIEDNGPGMDESTRRKIFDPFFTTKPTGEGTGLGLSVSYFIVTKNHKGTLEVESEPGHGARFIVTLPVRHEQPIA